MILITRDGKLIEPANECDRPMFMHCSNGSQAVTQEYYFGFVEPLLEAHGVTPLNGFDLEQPQ